MPQDTPTTEQDSNVVVTQIDNEPDNAPQDTSKAPPETPQDQSPTNQPQDAQDAAQPAGSGSEDPGLWEGVAEDHPLRKEVSSLRSESAARRSEVRRLQEANDQLRQQLESATSQEDFQAAIAEYDNQVKAAQLEAARERTARKYGLPDALVSRLAGDTEEELEADAQQLQALIVPATPAPPAPKNPPSGGLNPKEERVDPAQEAQSIRQRSATGVHSM